MEQNNSSLPKKNPLSMQIDLDKFAPATEEDCLLYTSDAADEL